MAIQWTHENENTISFHVSGTLTKSELDNCQSEAEVIIQKSKQIKILVIVTDFKGWDDSGDWTDLTFGERNDHYIQKMAIVGDSKWKLLAEMFTLKGLRKFPIEYFPENQDSFAKEWLATD